MSDASNFLSWVMEDFEEVCAEVGSPRNEQLIEFERKGFLRLKGTYHGTSCYDITSKWSSTLTSHHSRTGE
jgi:hypothetical protein